MTDPDRITALRALEAAMVEGKASEGYIHNLAIEAGMSWTHGQGLAIAYIGDPTAAFAVLRELVPGWRLLLRLRHVEPEWEAYTVRDIGGGVLAKDPDPARAISIAIVRALIWEAENA